MNKQETLKHFCDKFRQNNSGRSVRTIFGILEAIKQGTFGLTIDDAIDFVSELNGFKPHSIDKIANNLRYREKEYRTKHINYLRRVCRTIVVEPEKIYVRSDKMRIV